MCYKGLINKVERAEPPPTPSTDCLSVWLWSQKHPLVHENEQCKPIVIETIKFLYDLDMEEGKDVDLTNPIARPRVPHEIMFVVGGWSGGSPTNVIETYDTRADRWITVEYADRGH